MEEKEIPKEEILTAASDTVLQEPIVLTVDVAPRGWLHEKLQKYKLKPTKKVFTLTPMYLGTLMRVSKILIGIDMNQVKGNLGLDAIYTIALSDTRTMAECIGAAIHNKKSPVPKSLIEFIINNFTSTELYKVVLLVIKQMEVRNFITSIILIRGVSILEKPDVNAKPVN